jgi:hypothetical protein
MTSRMKAGPRMGFAMCGITAMYSPRGPISAAALEQATLRLAHRGPDGQRTWISGDRRVGLGHARLGIIDLATGEQPIRQRGLLTGFVLWLLPRPPHGWWKPSSRDWAKSRTARTPAILEAEST